MTSNRLARFATGFCLERNCGAAPYLRYALDSHVPDFEPAGPIYSALDQADESVIGAGHRGRPNAGARAELCGSTVAGDRLEV